MAEENDSVLHRIPYTGTFKDIADWLNANFHLIELAIKQNTGKSAYEVWRDYEDEQGNQPNIDKTEEEFLASLKESGYKMQAVTVRPSTIAGIEADKIYLYPDGTGQFSTAIYTGDLNGSYDSTKWVVLATNPGDLSGAFTDISGLRIDVNNLGALVGYYECASAAATDAKTVNATGYELTTGGNIRIKMTHVNTAASGVTLQIGSATAQPLYYNGELVSDENTWEAGETIVVYYDGASYYATNSLGGGGKNDNDDLSQFFNVVENVIGKNLLNTDLPPCVEGFLGGNDQNGAVRPNGGVNYSTSDYIPVKRTVDYNLVGNGTQAAAGTFRFLNCYDSSKAYIRDSNQPNVGGTLQGSSLPEGTAYIRVSFINNTNKSSCGVMIGADTPWEEYQPQVIDRHLELNNNGKSIDEKTDEELITKSNLIDYVLSQLENLDIPDVTSIQSAIDSIKQKTDLLNLEAATSKNLLNTDSPLCEDGYLGDNGTIKPNVSGMIYLTSDYIPVSMDSDYNFIGNGTGNQDAGKFRFLCCYDESKSNIAAGYQQYVGGTLQGSSLPEGTTFIRVTFWNRANKSSCGVMIGADTPWEEYHEPQYALEYALDRLLSEKTANELAVKKDVPAEEDEEENDKLTIEFVKGSGDAIDYYYIKDGSDFIRCTFDKWQKNQYYNGNHIFNFVSMSYKLVDSTDADDAAPMHIKGTTIGGNHSVTCKGLKATSHGLTDSDLGNTITSPNGIEFIIIRIVDSDNIWVLPKNTDVYSASTFSTGNAIYNGRTINVSTVSSPSIFPAACNQLQKMMVDGVETIMSESGSLQVKDFVDFVDCYDIVNFNDARNQLRVVDGKVIYESPTDVRVENVYRFLPGLKVLVIANVSFFNKTYFANVMFAQASAKIPYSDRYGEIDKTASTRFQKYVSTPQGDMLDINLVDSSSYVVGLLDKNTGLVNTSTKYCSSGLIEVEEGKTYVFSGIKNLGVTTPSEVAHIKAVCFYDSSGNFISGSGVDYGNNWVSRVTIGSGNGIKYIRFSLCRNYISYGYIFTSKFYVPGSTTLTNVGGDDYNYSEPTYYDIPNRGGTYNFDSATWADPQKPVNRVIQISKDNVGFAFGYLPVGVGADLLSNTSTTFEIRGNSGKIYPHGIDQAGLIANHKDDDGKIPANSVYNAVLYRIPFDAANQGEGRICLYDVDYNGYKYVFVDYSQTIFDHVELDDSLNGHTIELVEQRNAVLTSPVYNGGFYVNATHISGDSSYCVVKIKL